MNCSAVLLKSCTNDTTGLNNSNSSKVTFVFLGIFAVLIFLANSTVIYLYKNNRYLRTVTNFCLVFLAVSDSLAAVVAIPTIIICNTTRQACTTMDLASRFIAISTILHLMVVSTERYLMIVFPLRYIKLVSKSKVTAVLVGVWVFSLTVTLVQLSWVFDEAPPPSKHDLIYSITTLFGMVLPVLCFMIFIYSHIFTELRRQIKNIKKHNLPASSQTNELTERRPSKRGERRAVIVFGLMIMTFIFGWLPYFILTLLYDLNMISNGGPHEFWLFLRFATSLVNPLLYTFLKTDFKKAIMGRTRSKMSYRSVETQNETRV